jgi:hypothetical protein
MSTLFLQLLSLGAAAFALAIALLLRRRGGTRPARQPTGPASGDGAGPEHAPVPAVPHRPLGALSATAEAEPEEEQP